MTALSRCFFALALACSCSLSAANPYIIGGVVVDSLSHRPLANTRVLLALTTARSEKFEQITKRDGRFSFAVKQAGNIRFRSPKQATPCSLIDVPESADFPVRSSSAMIRTPPISSSTRPRAAIVGVIKDENSEPAGGAVVSVFQASVVGGERKVAMRGQTTATTIAEFRIANLQHGNYYLSATGRPWFSYSLTALEIMQESLVKDLARFLTVPKNIAPTPQAAIEPNPPEPPATQFSPYSTSVAPRI